MCTYRRWTAAVAIAASAFLVGCAANLPRTATAFTPSATTTDRITIHRDIEVAPPTGYRRTLKAGSTWAKVGATPQGTVYKVENDVFSLVGAHQHEAHAVVANGFLVGFYLPVEQAFVDISPDISLNHNK